jgi:hypothetical protein
MFNSVLILQLLQKCSVVHASDIFSEIADVFNCLMFLAYSSLYNLEICAQVFAAVQNIQLPPSPLKADDLSDLARQIAHCLIASHPLSDSLRTNLADFLSDQRNAALLCRIPAFLAVSMKLDGVQEEQLPGMMDLNTAGSILAMFNKRLPMELFAPQMKNSKKLDNRSRLLVNCYRYGTVPHPLPAVCTEFCCRSFGGTDI